MDFDDFKSAEEFKNLIDGLNEMKENFGNYVIGGYTKNQEINAIYPFLMLADFDKFISVHVIFYESRMEKKQIFNSMHDKRRKFKFPQHDVTVYKDDESKHQLFRHCCSNKNGKIVEKKASPFCYGNDLMTIATIKDTFVTPYGDEKFTITLDTINKYSYSEVAIDEVAQIV